MNILDHQKEKMAELRELAKENGTTVVQESLNAHRNELEEVSNLSLGKIKTDLPEASMSDTIKVYDTTRKHLNTLDGRQDTQAATIAIIPGELAQRFSLEKEISLLEKETEAIEGKLAE